MIEEKGKGRGVGRVMVYLSGNYRGEKMFGDWLLRGFSGSGDKMIFCSTG